VPKQILQFVDIDDIELQIPALNGDTVEELYRFGTLMVSEVQQRASQLDSKLIGIVGWAAATLAFLLFQNKTPSPSTAERMVTFVAIAFAVLSVLASCVGLKTAMWSFPSEPDWFRESLLDNAEALKQYHVVSMLNAHQQQHRMNGKKAYRLRYSEAFLAVSASLIAVVLFWKLP
jgi:hypothetical protein